jgi:hypothetical protein
MVFVPELVSRQHMVLPGAIAHSYLMSTDLLPELDISFEFFNSLLIKWKSYFSFQQSVGEHKFFLHEHVILES